MPPSFLLGIDLGTSSLKTVVYDPGGKIRAVAAYEYGVDTPHPGWAEQDPQVWYRAAVSTAHQALQSAGLPATEIAVIGLSGQMHGLVALDRQGRSLVPAIIWADQRSKAQVDRLREEVGVERLGHWTANPLATGFMLPSWLWLEENEPAIARQTASLLLPKDYLRFRLTGAMGSEPSDASSTSMFNPARREWSAELLEMLHIDPGKLPPVGESAAIAGELQPQAASEMGLRPGIPVVYGGSDQSCQAIGHGILEPGILSCTIGTGGQLLAPTTEPRYDPRLRLHLFCHALPGRWHLEAAILSAGLSLKWLRDSILEGQDYGALADLASTAPPGSEGLFFLPYLVGERTPHMDPAARGAWIGLALRHRRAHLIRALMEGVVFALRQGLELISILGGPATKVVASGGATQHPLWLQLQADIFNRPITRSETVEAAATGAALLGGVGIGIYPDISSACQQVVRVQTEVIEPDPARAAFYNQAYDTFCSLYPRLKRL
jgi:xylulokinase